jgi:AraC family transcriptional regulator of adaptative response / DNA-3-methyladenine glycosylase II
MTEDPAALYQAIVARDARFDGVFYVGVTTTGIYCRPVCTARKPAPGNCRFFRGAAQAESEGYRPCLICRPEMAPGQAPVDGAGRLAELVVQVLDDGLLDDGAGMERLASHFGWSSRHLRRVVRQQLGVSPMQLLLTRRLLLAKQLLTDTSLPVSQVALASGFSSTRRFNDAFVRRYRMPPSRFRATTGAQQNASSTADTLELRLAYRAPFNWTALLAFLGARSTRGVERVDGDRYLRTVSLGGRMGWVSVGHDARNRALRVELSSNLALVLPALLGRLRHLFDLAARPDVIAARLGVDERLARLVELNPGLRVPGAFDGFELAVRAILGQQVSVAAATTLAGRFAGAFGHEVDTPHESLVVAMPGAERVSELDVDAISALGIVRARAHAIVTLAREVVSGSLRLDPGASPDEAIARLVTLPGIGPWTAQYIAMRALRWPDAFPAGDLIVRRRLGNVTESQAREISRAWMPWRAYATMHLWSESPDAA